MSDMWYSCFLQNVTVVMTSVSGHLLAHDFKMPFRKWFVSATLGVVVVAGCIYNSSANHFNLGCKIYRELSPILLRFWSKSRKHIYSLLHCCFPMVLLHCFASGMFFSRHSCDPLVLFDAEIEKYCPENYMDIKVCIV